MHALEQTDAMCAKAARDGVEALFPAHTLLHMATSTTGDSPPHLVTGLSLSLRALHAALDDIISTTEHAP